MWVDPDDDPREATPEGVDERSTLLDYLRRYRLTLEMKCADLDAEQNGRFAPDHRCRPSGHGCRARRQLARRSVPPSNMSLLGLVRHMAEVERGWFRREMAGQDAPRLYCSDQDRDGDWNGARADPAVVADAWRAWQTEAAFADQFIESIPDLGTPGTTQVP